MLGHRKLEVSDYLAILKRRLWIILGCLVVAPVISMGFSYTIKPEYLSQTLVIIDQPKIPDEYVRSLISVDLDGRLASMKEQILSRSRIQPIVEKYDLYAGQHMSMDDKIDKARKDILINVIHSAVPRAAGLPGFSIAFKANEARTAQLVCGDITSLFVDENLRNRSDSAENTTEFLRSQLASHKADLDSQDAKLAAFKRLHFGKLPDEEASNLNMLSSLNTQLEAATQSLGRLEQERSYLQSMLAQVSASGTQQATVDPKGAVTVAPDATDIQRAEKEKELNILTSQEADLATQYTADHPDLISVRRRITELRKQISKPAPAQPAAVSGTHAARTESVGVLQMRAQLRAEEVAIQQKRTEQEKLQSAVRSYQDRIQSSPQVEEEYKQLSRDYESSKVAYDDLLGKMNQSRMATDLERRQQGEQFRVIDAANLPEDPISPKRPVFLLGGILAGLAIGCGIAALLEYRDTSLRSERDVWAAMGVPTLAWIPVVVEERAPAEKKVGRFFRKTQKVRPEAASEAGA